jgi:hypothetical protein
VLLLAIFNVIVLIVCAKLGEIFGKENKMQKIYLQ